MATPQNLVDLLNNREAWPAGFRWRFRYESTCAIGLAREKWGRKGDLLIAEISRLARRKKMGNPFLYYHQTESGIHERVYRLFFLDPSPKRVAKKIRQLIEA